MFQRLDHQMGDGVLAEIRRQIADPEASVAGRRTARNRRHPVRLLPRPALRREALVGQGGRSRQQPEGGHALRPAAQPLHQPAFPLLQVPPVAQVLLLLHELRERRRVPRVQPQAAVKGGDGQLNPIGQGRNRPQVLPAGAVPRSQRHRAAQRVQGRAGTEGVHPRQPQNPPRRGVLLMTPDQAAQHRLGTTDVAQAAQGFRQVDLRHRKIGPEFQHRPVFRHRLHPPPGFGQRVGEVVARAGIVRRQPDRHRVRPHRVAPAARRVGRVAQQHPGVPVRRVQRRHAAARRPRFLQPPGRQGESAEIVQGNRVLRIAGQRLAVGRGGLRGPVQSLQGDPQILPGSGIPGPVAQGLAVGRLRLPDPALFLKRDAQIVPHLSQTGAGRQHGAVMRLRLRRAALGVVGQRQPVMGVGGVGRQLQRRSIDRPRRRPLRQPGQKGAEIQIDLRILAERQRLLKQGHGLRHAALAVGGDGLPVQRGGPFGGSGGFHAPLTPASACASGCVESPPDAGRRPIARCRGSWTPRGGGPAG